MYSNQPTAKIVTRTGAVRVYVRLDGYEEIQSEFRVPSTGERYWEAVPIIHETEEHNILN